MKISAVRGFRDILPEESVLWQALSHMRELLRRLRILRDYCPNH